MIQLYKVVPNRIALLAICYLCVLLIFAPTHTAQAQISSYNFSQNTGTYTPLDASATTLFTATDDAVNNTVTIPFSFNYLAVNYTNCKVSTNGFLTLNPPAGGTNISATVYTPISSTNANYATAISGLGRDLNATVKYQTLGTSPNRVFVVEWSNAYRYAVSSAENINFQIKLYETTNVVEIQYGAITTPNTTLTTGTVEVGLKGSTSSYNNVTFTNANLTGYTYTNNWNSLVKGSVQGDVVGITNTIYPASGTILRWVPSSCTQVTVTATAATITASSAVVNWTANAMYASGYRVRWRKVDEPYTAATWATPVTVAAGTSTYTISGLAASTYYVYSIEGVCSATSANCISTVTTANTTNGKGLFKTTCPTYNLNVLQGFNATAIPSCWTQTFVSGSSNVQYVASSTGPATAPQEGSHYIYWNSLSFSSGQTTRLVSPAINTVGSPNVNVKFYWFHDNSAYTGASYVDEGVKLQYSLNGTTWTDVQAVNRVLTGVNGWTQYDIALPAAAGNVATVYVGFLFTSRFGNNCSMDDVQIYVPPVCTTPTAQPTGLVLNTITSTSLSGSFTPAVPAPTKYLVLQSTSNVAPTLTNGNAYTTGTSYTLSGNSYTVVANGTATSFAPTGLSPNTQYYYYVYSYNGSCAGAPYYLNTAPLTGNTLTCTAATSSLTGVAASTTSATITFSTITGASSYILSYSVAGANSWVVASPAPTTSPYTLTGLTVGTAYDIRLQGPNSSCGTNLTTNNAFTTPCATLPLTVTQGFEAGTTIPTCWTQQYVSGTKAFSYGSTATAVGTSPNPAAATGNNRLLFPSYSNSGNQTRFYSPPITTVGTTSVDVEYKWYYSASGGSGSYLTEGVQLQYSTNGTTWTNVGALTRRYGATDGWQTLTFTLPLAAGNQPTIYVGFLFTANAGYDSYMDDIVVRPTPTCLPPSALNITSITGTGATLNWAAATPAPSGGYQWELRTAGAGGSGASGLATSGSTAAGVLTAASGTLTPTTTYTLYVRSNCGSGDFSTWASSATFTTSCATFNVPYTQNFESTTTPNIPNCMSAINSNADAYAWNTCTATSLGNGTAIAPVSGVNQIGIRYNGSAAMDDWFFLPAINLNAGVTYLLTYYVRPYSSTGYEEKLEVKYGPIATAAGMTSGTLVPTETLIGGVAYTQKAAYFTPTTNGVYYIGFHGLSITNQFYLFIDDISLTVAPACTSVSGGAAIAARTNFCAGSGSTTLSATGYTTMGTGLTYQWQSSTNNFSSVVNDLPGATNPLSANTGIITANTSYRLKVTCTTSGLVAYSNIVNVTVGTISISGTTAATRCGIGTVTLQATASAGSTTSWYSTAVGGVSLATGSSFTTPTISSTTTYYVAANDGSVPATVGATYSGAADNGTSTGGHGIVFTTTGNDITILSAKIPFSGKGTFTIQLQNNAGTVLQTIVTDTLSGGGTTPITVPLNILVSTPGTYRLILNSITGTIDALGYLSSTTYPYTGLGGLFAVTSGYWYGNDVANMYFFDLMVTNMCESARYSVIATVTPPPALTLSSGDTTICSGSGVVMNVTNPVGNFNSYVWSPSTGVTHSGSPLGASSTLAPTTTTNYTLTATSASGCVNQKTALFIVNPAPPVTTSAAVCSGTAATLTASSSCNGYGAPTNTIAGSWTAGVDPVALRPIIFIANSPTCLFDNTVTRNYVTHTFQVTVSGSYTFDMTPNTNYDGMGYIVFGPFVPGNCAGGGTWVVGDDDSGPSSLEPLMTANLTVGTQYTLVTTTYSSTSGTVTDNFIWNITGPVGGQITTVSTGTLQWFTTATGGTSIGSGTPFNPVGVSGSGIASSSAVGSYTFYAACTNNLTCRTATTYVIGSAGQWIGGTDANWSNPANWCGGVPTISTNATIASGAPFKPVLSTGTGTVQNLTVQPGATLTVSNALMQISGAISATGSIIANNGTIELKGAATQAISGSSFTGRTIRNLVLSNSVNVSNVTGDTLRITGDLSFGNVNNKALNSGNNITLGSSSTRTARVTDLTNGSQNTGNSITGNFVVERYIPARRAWRLITAPIAIGAQTINQAWQENTGGNWALDPHPGYGTHISGGPARSTAQGFDQGPNTSSIFSYGLAGWNQIPTNLLTEKVTSNQGYMLFVRGSRIINLPLSTPVTVPDSTVLRPTGGIRTGSQPAVTNASGGFTVVGNPYPSPINFNNLTRSGVIGGNNTYYAWDPTLAGSFGVGAYVTLSWNGTDYDKSVISSIIDTTGIIPSGAAIMTNFSPGGSISFEESDKCAEAPGPVYHFRPNGSRLQLRASLLTVQADGIRAMNDGALITFNEVNDNNVTDEDAVKINNFFENWAIKNQGQLLSIERRNALASTDTIFFDMWNMRQRQYELWFDAQLGSMLQGYTAYLEDTYLQTKTLLQLDQRTAYGFSVTAAAASAARNRFRLIFAPANVLPVTITQIEAFQQNKDIVVKWQVQQELEMLNYQLQTSLDGIHFENCFLTNARGSGSVYQWLHVQPAMGTHYYRVKCINVDGTYRYSQIVMVKLSKDATPAFSIAPNPVQGHTLQLWYRQIRGGKFVGNIYNEGGQLIQTHAQLLTNGNGNWTIKLPEGLAAGVYQLILQNEQMEKYVLPFRLK